MNLLMLSISMKRKKESLRDSKRIFKGMRRLLHKLKNKSTLSLLKAYLLRLNVQNLAQGPEIYLILRLMKS
jgi:hypothetical protein